MAEALYRPNVGIALFNRDGQVLIGKCLPDGGPEIIVPGHEWQMPQGGMEEGEDVVAAAQRELWEETGVTSTAFLGQSSWAMTYDFPPYDGPAHKLSAFRGQRQRWVAFRFMGQESEIKVTSIRAGMQPEFSTWRWEKLERLPELVMPFKRAVYEQVVKEFKSFAAPA